MGGAMRRIRTRTISQDAGVTAGSLNIAKKKYQSKSKRAGTQFPVSKVLGSLRNGLYADKVFTGASVYTAAVLDYVTAEILDVASQVARDNNKKRITPSHIKIAIGSDEELDQLFAHVTIPQDGVFPIQSILLPKMTLKRSNVSVPVQSTDVVEKKSGSTNKRNAQPKPQSYQSEDEPDDVVQKSKRKPLVDANSGQAKSKNAVILKPKRAAAANDPESEDDNDNHNDN